MSVPSGREPVAHQVRRKLLERILSGDLAPGTRLRELHLAADLETSQGPVREALRELEMLGLIVTEPYKGSRVREVSKEDIREAYVVRAALEELAGKLAAPTFQGATGVLEALASDIRKAAKARDIGEYVRADIGFHRAIMEASGNKVLLRSWDALGFEMRIQIRLANSSLDLFEVQKEHWPIIEALGNGGGRTAGKLLREHIVRFASWADSQESSPTRTR
jgi:DNA-binding GntR family transcriptional regulator